MQIIDRQTGKRLIDTGKDKNAKLKDPVKRNVEKGLEIDEQSPMNPPDAYSSAHMKEENIRREDMPPLLQEFMQDHEEALKKIEEYEKALLQFRESGYKFNDRINRAFGSFFEYMDDHLIAHNTREEKILFPLLHQRLIKAGEHSFAENPTTAIDIMEDDHVKFIQLGTLTFNMLGLATRLQDEGARLTVFDLAYNNGRELVELLRLHIFREDSTLFPMAYKLISGEEFSRLGKWSSMAWV